MNEKYQLAVIGTGSGGSEAALLAAKKGFKVVVIEKGALGGTRLHHGSFAVRALHASARLHGNARDRVANHDGHHLGFNELEHPSEGFRLLDLVAV